MPDYSSFFAKEKEQLGLTGKGPDKGTLLKTNSKYADFFSNEKMDLGLSPETRPQKLPLSDQQKHTLDVEQSDQAQMAQAQQTADKLDQNNRNNWEGRNLPIIGPVLRGLDAFSTNPIVDKGAQILRSFYTSGAGAANVAGMAGAAESAVSRLAPGLGASLGGKIAKGAITEGLTGAPIGAGQALSNGGDLQDAATGAALGGAMGGGFGAVAPLIGRGLQSIRKTPDIMPPETLALPSSRAYDRAQRANGTSIPADGNPIYAPGDIHTFELPAPDLASPTKARIGKLTNPYEQKYNELIAAAKETPMMPGREYENLQELWSHMAGPQDPSLDELINLAYPKRVSKLSSESLSKAKTWQGQMDAYGVPGPVKGISDRYNPFIGEAAMPETKVGLNSLAKDGTAKVEIVPPTRKFPTEPPKVDPMPTDGSDPFNSFDARDLKDISGFSAQTRDVYRNLEASLGKDNAKLFLNPFNDAKTANVDMQKYWTDRLKSEVVDKLGIEKGSKLSGMVQKFGEKQISLDELKQQAPKDWEKVVEADKWFRNSYDHLIDIVNESRSKIYPNNPDKIVPKRSDYYRHFQDLNGLAGLKNLFDTPSAIDPSLSGISEFVKPKSKFAGFMQKRGLGPFKNDAVGGFLNYIPSASYSTHIDPQINVWRSLSKSLADNTTDTRNLNNTVEYLQDFANDLAGKTNPMDRFIQKVMPGGRKTMAAIQWLNNRAKANTVLGNASSALAQIANVPSGVAFAKQYAIKGLGETLASAIGKNTTPMSESGFLKERFAGEMYRRFDTKLIEQPMKFAGWLMETADRIGTNFIWNSAYAKAVGQKIAEPIRFADDATRKLVAGRGVGEVPIAMKSQLTQLTAPFQLEVANLWRVMGDFVKAKDFGAIATLFVGNYLLNRGMEKVRGSAVTFDPIQAMIEAMKPDLTPLQRMGRVGGEVLSNLPYGQTLAAMYPQYGAGGLPSRKDLFGNNDPTRFGSGLLAVKSLQDPLYKLALPFGGGQLKKTLTGIDALRNGGTVNGGKMNFPIAKTLANDIKLPIFGPNSSAEAQDYFNNNRRPLSKDQTLLLQKSTDPQKLYGGLMKQREMDTIKTSIDKLQINPNLSKEEKLKQYSKLKDKLAKVKGN